MSAQFLKRIGYAALALCAFVATSGLIHSLLPPMIPKDVAAKLEFFAQHKDEFDTILIGTSSIYYSVSPEIFDRTTRERGLPTLIFNFGIGANGGVACLALMVFRALNLADALVAVRGFVLFRSAGEQDLGAWMLWIVVALGLIHWLNFRGTFTNWWRRGPDLVFAAGYGCAVASVLLFIPPRYTPFIYFQF